MTELSPETALEIIAIHGGDPARWPADKRAGVLALAGLDAGVAAALVEARALDAALAGWAVAPSHGTEIDVAAILALPQQQQAAQRHAYRPALLAASLALVVAVGGWFGLSGRMPGTETPQIAAAPPSAGPAASEADAAFAYVFTPTPAEEDLI